MCSPVKDQSQADDKTQAKFAVSDQQGEEPLRQQQQKYITSIKQKLFEASSLGTLQTWTDTF